jgi:hypothetical protein
MDISEYLLTPALPYQEEGSLGDIGSVKHKKRALERYWDALDTIYVELPRSPCTSVPNVPRETITWTREEMRELSERLLNEN